MPGPAKGDDIARFWSKVDKRGPDECWLWKGGLRRNGYGYLGVGSHRDGSDRIIDAHRFACEIAIAKRPLAGRREQALHRCDNKRCCNPAHLYIGTHKDNMRDMKERIVRRKPDMRGERNPRCRLTEEQVAAIRASRERNVRLAEKYGVTKTHIGDIKSGKSWQ